MGIGNGIAIAGIWVCSGLMWHSRSVSAPACLLSSILALALTWWLK